VNFDIPSQLQQLLDDLDDFIAREIKPLEEENIQFFDYRREWARTDFENGGVPRKEWEELLGEMRRRADRAGFLRYPLPSELGGRDGTNLDMAVIRDHLAAKGLGLHNDLQNEASIVGNFPVVLVMHKFGTPAQKEFVKPMLGGEMRIAFGITEPDHGSDATWMETRAVKDGNDWIINGAKRFNSGMHRATHDIVFARTSGDDGQAKGITAFLVPVPTEGLDIPYYHWTFNMPTDHAEVELKDVRVPDDAIVGGEGNGLACINVFTHENRIRQAASGVGAASYCIDESVAYARNRVTFGKPLSERQAIQWPLVELQTDCEMLRNFVRRTAWEMDRGDHLRVSDKVSMCNYRANRLVCQAADTAMQVHGGIGYTRAKPFEHIYRHHRRYRITEGSEEIQIRNVAGHIFGYVRRG
jgi:alkylation response protein AidB-like acyl-CoA dehydrogenase